MVTRKDFIKTSTLVGSGLATGLHMPFIRGLSKSPPKKRKRPNIILFYGDDGSRQHLGCYGNKEIKTPNIDSIAAEGIKMMDFTAASSVCCPCRGSLLTGRYPQRNGMWDNIRNNDTNYGHEYKELEYCISPEMTQGMDVREVIISEVLKEGGYRTGVFGKWDSGRAPQFRPLQRGFDDFYGICNTGVDYYTHERYGIPSLFRGNKRIKEEGYATDLFKREVIRFIEENKDEPFFAYVPFNAPHSSSSLTNRGFQAPAEYIKMYGDLPGTTQQKLMATITCMDDAIGEVLKTLKELNLEEDTLVIYTSDQGAGGSTGNVPLRGGKGSFYEGNVRVPFVAKWPGHISPGSVSSEFCSALDLFPTFVNIAQCNPPDNVILDGYDITSVLTDQAKSPRNEIFWELRNHRAARIGNWKWVLSPGPRWTMFPDDDEATGELYDLSGDIEEQHDLAAERTDIVKKLKARWSEWMQEMAEAEDRGPFCKEAYFDLLGFGNGHYRLD
jgi:arylsulfatase A